LWFLGLLFINFTPLLSFLAKKMGIGRGVDLAVYTSIILIFYFLYLINVEIYELKKRIEKLVRELALKNKIKDWKRDNKDCEGDRDEKFEEIKIWKNNL